MNYPADYAPLRPGGLDLTRRLVSFCGDITRRRFLDLGCGRGETAALLAREYGAAVTGADLSSEMIDECRRRYPDIRFERADGQDLPFADASFDIAVSECSFSVFPDPAKAFREVSRILVPGGWLLLSDLYCYEKTAAGNGMVRNLYTKNNWLDMAAGAGFAMTAFADERAALSEMYVQMIFDLGLEGAQRKMGLCLPKSGMKNVSYMMLAAKKSE